ncbi:YqcI/YcgG family protein [Methylobacterium sp. UNC300MFChir4.1]|uniref:YqcI/YcgG family protein n=1 Tax=Methylobacterium sp. UNC300MFChir4.1 TaxID=1502747 RepID=UPI0008B8DC03|nr:YqcI/YcgG family protein [Methylobacterium sp. UNC300MFChir4.1]SEO74338.1 YqcI/YcgG family protein [Methylobacterium sp. UNC300MFChir4.1]
MRLPPDDRVHPSAEAFRAFIRDAPFPCVGAKSALVRGRLRIVVARDIRSSWDDMRIYPALLAFIASYKAQPDLFQSFAVVFEGPGDLDEVGVASVDGIAIYGREMIGGPGAHDLDPTFLILDVRKLGMSGYEADEWLQAERKVSALLGDLRHIGFSFSLGTTDADAERLVEGVRDLAAAARGGDARFLAIPNDAPDYASLASAIPTAPALPPPQAAAAKFDRVPYEEAVGRISGQSVAVVPPPFPACSRGSSSTPRRSPFSG